MYTYGGIQGKRLHLLIGGGGKCLANQVDGPGVLGQGTMDIGTDVAIVAQERLDLMSADKTPIYARCCLMQTTVPSPATKHFFCFRSLPKELAGPIHGAL